MANILDTSLALGSVPYNFARGIIGNLSNPGAITEVSLTQAQKERLNEIAQAKGTPTGTIDYSDYGSPTKTFSGIIGMNPLDASLATTMGGTGYTTNPDGSINYTGGAYDFGHDSNNPITNFINKGGIIGAVDKFGQNIYDKLNPSYEDDEYDFSGIEGHTAGLGVASFLKAKFGPKIGTYLFKKGKFKTQQEIGKRLGPIIKKKISGGDNKIITKKKKISAPPGEKGGPGYISPKKKYTSPSPHRNGGGGSTGQATSKSSGKNYGPYSKADGGLINFYRYGGFV